MTSAQTLRHVTLNCVHALRWLRLAVVAVYWWMWGTVVYLAKHKGSKLECIQRDVKELKKLPLHLALLVNEQHMSHEDLARLVNWCFAVGIQYVSLFDPRGVLKGELQSLRHAVEEEHGNLFSSSHEQVIVSSSDDCQESPSHHDVHSVLVLGPEDGQGNLSDVARSLCELVVQHRAAVGEIDSSLINSKLIGTNQGYPDPNLAVVTGKPHSLLGYLPWHTRLTEIIFITSHHKITYQQFYSLLCRYANTTQRFGK